MKPDWRKIDSGHVAVQLGGACAVPEGHLSLTFTLAPADWLDALQTFFSELQREVTRFHFTVLARASGEAWTVWVDYAAGHLTTTHCYDRDDDI